MVSRARIQVYLPVPVSPRISTGASYGGSEHNVGAAKCLRETGAVGERRENGTREPIGTSVMRSGREWTMAVKPIPSARHTLRIP